MADSLWPVGSYSDTAPEILQQTDKIKTFSQKIKTFM